MQKFDYKYQEEQLKMSFSIVDLRLKKVNPHAFQTLKHK